MNRKDFFNLKHGEKIWVIAHKNTIKGIIFGEKAPYISSRIVAIPGMECGFPLMIDTNDDAWEASEVFLEKEQAEAALRERITTHLKENPNLAEFCRLIRSLGVDIDESV